MTEPAKVATIAAKEIGYREKGENDTKYNRWLGAIPGYGSGGYGYPWCASFTSWVFNAAGMRANVDYPKTASCLAARNWYKAHSRWSSSPHEGDQVLYGPDGGTHTEIVTAVTAGSFTTIGGNTSGSLNGAYHNGDGVYRKTISKTEGRIYGFGRPDYTGEDMATAEEIWNFPIDTGDGGPTWYAKSVLGNLEKDGDRTNDMLTQVLAKLTALDARVASLEIPSAPIVADVVDEMVRRLAE